MPKNLTDWFNRVYLINCAHRPDRLDKALKHLDSSGMADPSKVIIYPAVVGEWTGYPADWKAGRGAWGCLQSHRRILEDVMHVRDERGAMALCSTLILEDDVFFTDDALPRLNHFMDAVPADWGQIYLGGQHRHKTIPTAHPCVLRAVSVNRTHAYAVSRHAIAKVYCHISYMTDYRNNANHIDHQLERAHRRGDWPVYCPPKWIAGQDAGFSNISGKTNPKNLWA